MIPHTQEIIVILNHGAYELLNRVPAINNLRTEFYYSVPHASFHLTWAFKQYMDEVHTGMSMHISQNELTSIASHFDTVDKLVKSTVERYLT